MAEGDQRLLRIGEVAEAAGTTPRTIRYYEEIGLLPAAGGRAPGSHRVYERADVEGLRELLNLKDLLGVSLEELRELASAESARAALRREWRSGVDEPVRRREILDEALGHIDRQLELIRRRRDQIAVLEKELVAKRRRVASRPAPGGKTRKQRNEPWRGGGRPLGWPATPAAARRSRCDSGAVAPL